MSYIDKTDLFSDEQDVIDINDPTDWTRRKLKAMFDEIEGDVIKKYENVFRDFTLERQIGLLCLFNAVDIEKLDIGGNRVSVKKNPEYFNSSFQELREILRSVVQRETYRVTFTNDEIVIRYGSTLKDFNNIYVDYFIQIDKTPLQTKDLVTLSSWGQWI